jgi:excisionase family DNA binding protein
METLQITQLSRTELESIIQNNVTSAVSKVLGSIPQNDDLLSFKDAAKFLNLAAPTLYRHTSKGTIPFLKRGKKILFSREKLIKWMHGE